jgi:ABC-type multidrug transport system ATPase subunit
VDNETEIQNAISKLIQGKTVLVIAHRMRTIEAADQIVVLDKGVVAEKGSHDELMRNRGLYRKLVELLSGFSCPKTPDVERQANPRTGTRKILSTVEGYENKIK